MNALFVALALASIGCVTIARQQCHVEAVRFYWVDGTVQVWQFEVCAAVHPGVALKVVQ